MPSDVFIPLQALKGRGVAHRQPHRFERDQRAAFDDGWGTLDVAASEGAAPTATEVMWEACKSAITRNDSPDIGFSLGLNPYRGCEHGCIFTRGRRNAVFDSCSAGRQIQLLRDALRAGCVN